MLIQVNAIPGRLEILDHRKTSNSYGRVPGEILRQIKAPFERLAIIF